MTEDGEGKVDGGGRKGEDGEGKLDMKGLL